MRALAMYLAGAFALVVLCIGVLAGLPLVIQAREDYGSLGGVVALAALFLACVVAALGAFRLTDRLTRQFGPLGRAVVPDHLYCQRCGQPVPLQAQFCPACGHTRLGLRRPASVTPIP